MKHTIWLRILAFLLTIVMLSGCGSTKGDSNPNENNQNKKEEIISDDKTEDSYEDNATDDEENENNKESEEQGEEISLDQKQKNSVAMLNYLIITTEQIRVSQNNRLLLDDVSSFLKNEIKPSKIDQDTKQHIWNILGVINDSQMNAIKRERLQYFYNLDKANAVREAVPDPLTVLSVSNALNWKRLVSAVVYTAVDSYNNYNEYYDKIEREYLIKNMELDDQEKHILDKNSNYAWDYMVTMVNKYGLPDELALTEEAIRDFAKVTEEENVQSRRQSLESKEKIYKGFGKYWLELANCYYELKEYKKCLESVEKYEELSIEIYRRDYDYADILPKAIVAAQEIYDENAYIEYARKTANAIKDNSKDDNWALRYFAAQIYLDIYNKTGDTACLNEVYEIALDNVNELKDKQEDLNNTYLKDIKEPKSKENNDEFLTKEEKRKQKEEEQEVRKYYKNLKKKRETELPALYEPLILNCDLLFGVIEKIEISKSDKVQIEGILEGVFLSRTINDRYSFKELGNYKIEFAKNKLIIPVELLTENAEIIVTVKDKSGTYTFDDWTITKVTRKGERIQSFKALYSSKEIKSYTWSKNSEIVIEIKTGESYEPNVYQFKVREYKGRFLISDKIEFEQI